MVPNWERFLRSFSKYVGAFLFIIMIEKGEADNCHLVPTFSDPLWVSWSDRKQTVKTCKFSERVGQEWS